MFDLLLHRQVNAFCSYVADFCGVFLGKNVFNSQVPGFGIGKLLLCGRKFAVLPRLSRRRGKGFQARTASGRQSAASQEACGSPVATANSVDAAVYVASSAKLRRHSQKTEVVIQHVIAIPKPPRIEVFPEVPGEYAKPMRGDQLLYCGCGAPKVIRPGTLAAEFRLWSLSLVGTEVNS